MGIVRSGCLTLMLCCGGATAIGQATLETIVVRTIAEVETITQQDGHPVTMLAPADRVVPGDAVIYTLEIRNSGTADIVAPSVVKAVPEHMLYVADSARRTGGGGELLGRWRGHLRARRESAPGRCATPCTARGRRRLHSHPLEPADHLEGQIGGVCAISSGSEIVAAKRRRLTSINTDYKDVFGAAGPLARALPGYSYRPEQAAMAAAVGHALANAEPLIVEAGTGTGKTFAYLVPALLSGRSVIISTGTRTLQDQLFRRDLPMLAKALGLPVKDRAAQGPRQLPMPASSRTHAAATLAAGWRARHDGAAFAGVALGGHHAGR